MVKRFVASLVFAAAVVIPGVALAGSKVGPQELITTIKPHAIDSYNVALTAGDLARVTVQGNGNTDLDCFLYDENGNVVARDDDASDACVLTVVPKWTGNFRIVVKNNGSTSNAYELKTN